MKKLRIEHAIVLIIVSTLTLATALTILQVWVGGSRLAESSVSRLFSEVVSRTEEHTQRLLEQALDRADLGAAVADAQAPIGEDVSQHPFLPTLRRILTQNPSFYGAYVGRSDGSLLAVIAPHERNGLVRLDAPADTAQALHWISLDSGHAVERWLFLDAAGQSIGRRVFDPARFDPRDRTWYREAQAADQAILTAPYVYFSQPLPGLTAARALPDGKGAVGIDITLGSLDHFLADQHISPNGALFLLDDAGRLLAAPPPLKSDLPPLATLPERGHPLLRLAAHLRKAGKAMTPTHVTDRGEDYIFQLSRWQVAGRSFETCAAAPATDFTMSLRRMSLWIILLSLGVLAVSVPLTILLARAISRPIRDLAEDAERIREMDFSGEPATDSAIAEFHTLADVFTLMKRTLLSRTRDLETSQAKLRRQLELGMLMNAESDIGRLAENILREACRLAHAECATLYVRTADERLVAQYRHCEDAEGLTILTAAEIPPVALRDADGTPVRRDLVAAALHGGKPVAVADIGGESPYDFTALRDLDRRTGRTTVSVLAIPLRPRGGGAVGVILLLNAHEEGKPTVIPFRPSTQRFVEGLAAQAAIALQNRTLMADQEALVNSMVRIVASAIDAKSPYTADHSTRVAALARMLAEEAGKVETGTLADFRLKTPAQWSELDIAAHLHDCGKVTTPEYVVDKATKLETIHNRIHEIRTRFEVLLRDADLARWRAIAEGQDAGGADAVFAERERQLREDFTFIAECNIGSEFMAPERIERVKRIAARTWMRHFDDRLGLSYEEARRVAGQPKPELPVEEHLLADKPEQIIPWTGEENFRKESWHFTTRPPAVMYNRGEVYNLCIPRGTLTPEERFKINEHVIQSIIMLETLPFPRHLRHVPEYACAHHESLDGHGYPRGLTGEQMSIPARIMAVADVFEALTSADRPYKKAKPLSEAIAILSDFRDRHHLDPDIFDLLLRSGVYRRYAEQYLRPDQLDAVDVERHLNRAEA